MAAEERWYFTKQQLADTPNRKCGIDPDRELSNRQQAANFIQDMGQRLQVNQLCINTAIVYMHRFYMFHTFTKFHRNAISTCALFLAAKVEEQPRKLEHVIKVAHLCLHREAPPLDTRSEGYLEQAQELVINENIMLQTLGFDVAIDHPHTHVVKCCQLVRGGSTSLHQHHASKDLAQTSYFMATNSLHLTTMCLQYKPTVVACVCIHLACKWGNWEIPKSSEGKKWFFYVDKTVTEELLEDLTSEFLAILDRCPSRLKRKMMSANTGGCGEFSELNCASLTSASGISTDGVSLTLKSLSSSQSTSRGERLSMDRHDRASTSGKSGSSHKSTPSATVSSAEKNGPPSGAERKERVKKEHISSSAGSFVNSGQATSVLSAMGDSSQQLGSSAAATSPGKSVKIANNVEGAQLSMASGDGSLATPKKQRPDGSSRTMTPKEYHEYRERNKREKEKPRQSSVTEQNRIAAVKQAGSASSGAKQSSSAITDGFCSTDADDLSNSILGSTRVPVPGIKRSPDLERLSTPMLTKSVQMAGAIVPNDVLDHSSMTDFLILTPSPPSTKDGDPYRNDEDMAVFTSPSDLLVPVNEIEHVQPVGVVPTPIVEPKSFKFEHKKQRKEEQKLILKSPPPLSFTNLNNELNKPSFNSTLATPEVSRKREKSESRVTEVVMDIKPCIGDSEQTPRKHHSVKNSSEKLVKHHRVKKSQMAPVSVKSDTHSGGDASLPQSDVNLLLTDHANQNFRFSSVKLPESNCDLLRVPSEIFQQQSVLTETVQRPLSAAAKVPNVTKAPTISPEPVNDLKTNLNFQEKRHSNHLRSNAQVSAVPPILQQVPEYVITNEKHALETDFLQAAQSEKLESESRHSKRGVQSSSSRHEKKEKRKKHDKKEKSREHSKEKGEGKLVPKFKLTIPKETNAVPAKVDVLAAGSADNSNHKPKDESLVVKIKLNTSAMSGGRNNRNGNLPEVVPSAPPTETLAIKERTGLKLKLTKNPSSKESYSIGNDEVKSKEKKSSKESRKRSRSSSSPKTKDLSHENEAIMPPAKVVKTTQKKIPTGVNNNQSTVPLISNPFNTPTVEPVVKMPVTRQIKNEAAVQQQLQQQQQPQQMLPVSMTNNNIDYNRRGPVHERRGGKRGRGNMRMGGGGGGGGPIVGVPPPPMPMPHPQQQAMMYNMPMGMFDRGAAAGDAYSQFYNFGQNNFFNHQMAHGFQDENPMFFNPPLMRPPPPHPMAFQAPPIHQQSRRGGHPFIRPPVLPPRSSSGPPLPSVPPPMNPPLPPDM